MALGFFDGVHEGHKKVIQTAAKIAKQKNVSLSVMSFFPHPKTILSNEKKQMNYLMPLQKKEICLSELGVDTFYIVEFDKEFASLLPKHFVVKYMVNLGVVHAVAGFDFSYGCKGWGNLERLKSDSCGFIDVTKVGKIEFQSRKISSTLIREKLLKGNVEELPFYLGSHYEVECDWNGHSLKPRPYYTLPASGCYAVTLKFKGGTLNTQVIVCHQTEGPELICKGKIPEYMKGSVAIVWNQRILESFEVKRSS